MPTLKILVDTGGAPYEESMTFDNEENADRAFLAVAAARDADVPPYSTPQIENEHGECLIVRVCFIKSIRIER